MKTVTYDETKWVLVPVKMTKEMMLADFKAAMLLKQMQLFEDKQTTHADAIQIMWIAMLAAAPEVKP